MASPDANAVIIAMRDQMAGDYGRINVELALLRAENAALRDELEQIRERTTVAPSD